MSRPHGTTTCADFTMDDMEGGNAMKVLALEGLF